jgi:predicted LPLAT superfamily acyltransferase
VAVVLSAKTGPASYELKLYDVIRVPGGLGRGEASFAPHASRFARSLERFCAEHPYQFFNFFDLWHDPDRAEDRRRTESEEL